MEKHLKAELGGFPVHHLHEANVAVAGHVRRAEDRRHLVLPGGHLVVLHGHGAANLQHLSLNVVQKGLHAARHGLEVVQVSLLVAGGQLSEEGSAGVHQVRTGLVQVSPHHEELLLPAKVAEHALGVGADADVLEEAETMEGDGVHGPQEWGLLIDALAEVRHEGAGDVKAVVQHERRGGPVPGGEGCGRVGHAQAAVREGGAIRLPLKEALRRQAGLHRLGYELGAKLQVHQRVLLEGAEHAADRAATATEREKPVGKIDGAALPGPGEDVVRNHLLIRLRRGRAAHQALVEAGHHGRGQSLRHDLVIEHTGAHLCQGVSGHG
mmetsp:Transcript_33006/g.61868  ORF Transcript_33006/g.61868 Transcript_33006/m.61868 type:complete len:324 (-) Transcript_33006:51-1022(-)